MHQRGDYAQRLAARQALHRAAGVRFVLGTQALDVVVQRRFDIQQGTGYIQQGVLVGLAHAVGDFVQYPPLFDDQPARYGQREHAQRIADTIEHFALLGQLCRITVALTQEQVQRLLDAQQVIFKRTRYRIEQRTVVAGHRAARVFQFPSIGYQAVQGIGIPQQLHLRAALLGLGHDVQQFAGDYVRFATAQAVFAVFNQLANAAIDFADQLADFASMTLDHALLETLQHTGSDPPQAPAVHVIATGSDGEQCLAHATQLLRNVLSTEPAQQLLLEAQTQIHQLAAMRFGIGRTHGRRRQIRQERIEIGMEHRRLGQRRLLAACTQVVEQRQQHHRHIAMAAGQPLKVIGQLHQAAHQRGISFLAIGDVILKQRNGEGLHFRSHHRRTVQLDHPQGAVHLMQMSRARTHDLAIVWILDVGLQRLAGSRQRLVELRLDPLQCGEIDVILKSHAPLSTVAQCRITYASRNQRDCPLSNCRCQPGQIHRIDVNPAA